MVGAERFRFKAEIDFDGRYLGKRLSKLVNERWAELDTAQRVGVDKFGALFDDFDAGIHEVAVIDAGQAVDFGMHGCRENLVVVGHLADAPAIPPGMLDVLSVAAGIDHELFRHTAADDAGAAHPVFFRHRDFGSRKRSQARGAHTAGTASDDE